MRTISKKIDAIVRARAGHRCEYCLVGDGQLVLRHVIDHILALSHGGRSSKNNLALACDSCNRHKGQNLSGYDSRTRVVIPIFNPRTQLWMDHFKVSGGRILGLTPCGRATISALKLNDPVRVDIRRHLAEEGVWPADED